MAGAAGAVATFAGVGCGSRQETDNQSGIHVVREHVLESEGYRKRSVHTAHQGYFPLLLVADRVRHKAETGIGPLVEFPIGHSDSSLVMFCHQLDKQTVEGRRGC
jgi:hypothetical protein